MAIGKVRLEKQDDSQFRVPPGEYRARLAEVKLMPPSEAHPDWGESLVWDFEVMEDMEGDTTEEGKRVSCFTKTQARTGNNLGKLLLHMVTGFKVGDEVDIDGLVGRQYRVDVELNQEGTRTKVTKARPWKKAGGGEGAAPAPKQGQEIPF